MKSLNEVTLLGTLGADVEIRTTTSGDRVANMRLATDESFRRDGELVKRTEWHRVNCWIPAVVEYLSIHGLKGTPLLVQGALKTRKWVDQSGVERYSTEIEANNIINLTKKPATDQREEEPAPRTSRGRKSKPAQESFAHDDADSIPF